MRKTVLRDRVHPAIREVAMSLVRDLRQKDRKSEVERIFKFVRDRIRYVRDTRGIEYIQEPHVILETGTGDCDDKTILVAALLESIGFPARFVAAAFGGFKSFSHVFAQVFIENRWVSLDATEPRPVGWEPPGITRRMILEV